MRDFCEAIMVDTTQRASLTYLNIAVRQLDYALSLYLEDGDLVCAITLAGAAEEILGRLAEHAGHETSLKRGARQKREMFNAMFSDRLDPGVKPFIELSNRSRNMMKHIHTEPLKEMDLDIESGRLIKRAIDNYALVVGRRTQSMRRFESEYIKRSRRAPA